MRKQSELKKALAKKLNLTLREAKTVFDTIEEIFLEDIKNGEGVRLFKFGKLLKRKMPARKIITVETGDVVEVPEKNRLNFRASAFLKKEMN